MTIEIESNVMNVSTMLRSLAEPNRLRIFATLMSGDSCNCELQEKLGLSPNNLSHHLRTLEKSGLVQSRRDQVDGRWIYYSVDRQAVSFFHNWFNHFLDPTRIEERSVCGPEGQLISDVLVDSK